MTLVGPSVGEMIHAATVAAAHCVVEGKTEVRMIARLLSVNVCIGDQYRVGGALFEVTQPRATCYVGIRMDEPRMAALLVAHGRPGFYFRALQEGRGRGWWGNSANPRWP